MDNDKMKLMTDSLSELSESYVDLIQAVKGTAEEMKNARKLWREGNKSKLMKLGLTLIFFPEPTPISETVGAFLLAAGAVKKGVEHNTLYADDVYKTFRNTLKEVQRIKHQI
jgi:hypothetical protein